MGVFLAVISVIFSLLLYPFGLALTFFKNLYKRQWKYAFKRLDSQFLSIATSVDASGNVVCKDLFDAVLIKKSGYRFGNRKETISSVLGKNKKDKTLTIVGLFFADVLDFLDENHCIKSIDNFK